LNKCENKKGLTTFSGLIFFVGPLLRFGKIKLDGFLPPTTVLPFPGFLGAVDKRE